MSLVVRNRPTLLPNRRTRGSETEPAAARQASSQSIRRGGHYETAAEWLQRGNSIHAVPRRFTSPLALANLASGFPQAACERNGQTFRRKRPAVYAGPEGGLGGGAGGAAGSIPLVPQAGLH